MKKEALGLILTILVIGIFSGCVSEKTYSSPSKTYSPSSYRTQQTQPPETYAPSQPSEKRRTYKSYEEGIDVTADPCWKVECPSRCEGDPVTSNKYWRPPGRCENGKCVYDRSLQYCSGGSCDARAGCGTKVQGGTSYP